MVQFEPFVQLNCCSGAGSRKHLWLPFVNAENFRILIGSFKMTEKEDFVFPLNR